MLREYKRNGEVAEIEDFIDKASGESDTRDLNIVLEGLGYVSTASFGRDNEVEIEYFTNKSRTPDYYGMGVISIGSGTEWYVFRSLLDAMAFLREFLPVVKMASEMERAEV